MSAPDTLAEANARLNSAAEKQIDASSAMENGAPPSGPANSTPTTSVDVSPAPETALPLETPQSQPMTATASSSSQNPPQENGGASAAGSYGTRSRHRTGTRPNYAEDKDLDIELESSPKASRASKRSSAANEQQTVATSSGFAAINHSASEQPSDNVPTGGTSTPVPSTAPAPSKKRKHPGSSHPVASTHHNMPANSRSRHAVSVPLKGFVETNMMSFSGCGRKLNAKKQLVADDGTTVQANGTFEADCSVAYAVLISLRSRLSGVRTTRGALLPCAHHGVFARKERSRRPGRFDTSELVLQTQGHPTPSPGHPRRLCLDAFRHMPTEFPTRQM